MNFECVNFVPSSPSPLLIAAVLDYLIGDPWDFPHPVRVMGWLISQFNYFAFKYLRSERSLYWAGVVLGLGLILGSGSVSWLMVYTASQVHPLLGLVTDSILLASCFAGRSLRTAAEDVLQPLKTGDLVQARAKLSLYVGRDTQELSAPEILRAVLETVAENATDGVMAPLFYAIASAFIPYTNVAFLPLAYKAASTLDSMVGYREAPYTHLGRFSAKLEDRLTWLPCRLTLLTLALRSLKPLYVWQMCQRDAIKDPSPNSGWSECAYASVLGVQLGGTNWYRGVAKQKPLLGDAIYPITAEKIHQALQLTRYCFLLWLGLGIGAIAISTYSF
ncbi:adenosylcobinamide-phosphate synthase CbiB [Chroococcidiopsis sp [FACHB-1243]]|uniref:adenosylcobinamide-phosphate synthase CbiB n=1 Tax=Chroococcidiopsis sp. [FACHB-1243] TaxID=2692781 RepID=UPI00321F7EDB